MASRTRQGVAQTDHHQVCLWHGGPPVRSLWLLWLGSVSRKSVVLSSSILDQVRPPVLRHGDKGASGFLGDQVQPLAGLGRIGEEGIEGGPAP